MGRLSSLIRQGERTRKSSLDLNQIVRETLPLVRSEVQQNEVSMTVELAAKVPPVLADRVQIQQVLLNLIINALEAMSAVTDRPRELRIASGVRGAEAVVISIEDSGIGVRPEQQGLIFDAFFTTKEQGMGMGLAISRSIVEDHGGRLSVASVAGAGSTFEVSLPAQSAEG